jgi:hypothetical protein
MTKTFAAACLVASLAVPAAADEAAARAAARTVLGKYADAVVTVRVVLKRRMVYQGREQGSAETQMEIGGTVIAANGLTVVSDSSSNPSGSFAGGDTRIETDTTDVKILLKDGREVPAKFLLRDEDLDLAFLMPEETGLKLPYVEMVGGAPPAPLDDLVVLYRLGRSMGREPAIATMAVRAVVKRPRTFVVGEMVSGLMGLGFPVFDTQSRPVGLLVMRRTPGAPVAPSSMREMFDVMLPVVLTAGDVAEVAAQAATKPVPAASPASAATPAPKP